MRPGGFCGPRDEKRIELLPPSHERAIFDCGKSPLNSFIRQQCARQSGEAGPPCDRRGSRMKKSDQYHKWVDWSEEDGAYIGKCPDLITGIHGDDPKKVYIELCEVIEDVIAHFESEGARFPPPGSSPCRKCSRLWAPYVGPPETAFRGMSGRTVDRDRRERVEAAVARSPSPCRQRTSQRHSRPLDCSPPSLPSLGR